MLVPIAVMLAYSAFVAFHHAEPRRAGSTVIEQLSIEKLHRLRWVGWALLFVVLWCCISVTDVARGIAIWLGIISVTAAASLIVSVLRPRWHLRSVGIVAVLAISSAALLALKDT